MLRPFSIFVIFFALSMAFWTCFEKACLWSNVRYNLFTPLFVEMSVMLFIVTQFC